MSKVADLSDEFAGCVFGDKRLTDRAKDLVDALSQRPNVSIPAALHSKADIEGCYRFFDNEKVTPEKILEPHIKATRRRIDLLDFVLLVQDTTELDLTRPNEQVQGAGPMDSEARRGAFYHPMIAFDGDGVALGLVGQKSWTREEISTASKAEKNKKRKQTPFEDKESYRWLEGLQCAERTAAACPATTCVCVGDSESDIYDVFAAADKSNQKNLQLLVRAGQNRNTADGQNWAEEVRKTAKIGEQTVTIRSRKAKIGEGKSARSKSREARIAKKSIHRKMRARSVGCW